MNVEAVLKITSLLFKLSILGLNSFTTCCKQEEGIKTWKKILGKTNVFHTSGHGVILLPRSEGLPCRHCTADLALWGITLKYLCGQHWVICPYCSGKPM